MTLRKTIPIIVITLLLIVLYYSVFSGLIYDWDTNPDYSHGYFIPFITGFMVWSRRKDLSNTVIKPCNWGIALILIGLTQFILGTIGAEQFLKSTSIIIVILGITIFLAGLNVTRILLLPLIYLIFMIPLPAIIWKEFAFSLRLFASKIAVTVMHIMGITVLREGNIIFLPDASLEVVDACSGMRSIVTLLALGALFAFMTNQSLWKKWILFLSAIPIAIISNIIRLIVTAFLVQLLGEETAINATHTFSGIGTFLFAFLILLFIQKLLALKPDSALQKP